MRKIQKCEIANVAWFITIAITGLGMLLLIKFSTAIFAALRA